jgi:predicted Fe-Mo cluster-binding NifX family protein
MRSFVRERPSTSMAAFSSKTIVCVPVTSEGLVDHSWGRAHRVAVASVGASGIEDWQEHDVAWDELHDTGSEGSHHARVARFLREHEVEAVAAHRMGPAMQNMLGKMGLTVRLGAGGDARAAAASVRD